MPNDRPSSSFSFVTENNVPWHDTYILDGKGYYQYVNAPRLLHNGYDPEKMIGVHYEEILEGEHLAIVAPYFEAALQYGHSSSFPFPSDHGSVMIGVYPYCGVYTKVHCIKINVSYVRDVAVLALEEMGIFLSPPRFPTNSGTLGG